MTDSRICRVCNQEKPIEEFRKDKRRKNTRSKRCNDCEREANRLYSQENRDKVSARATEWQIDNREQANKNSRSHRDKNREKINADKKRRRAENIETERKRDRDYYQRKRKEILARKSVAKKLAYHADVNATRKKKRDWYAENADYFKTLVHAQRAKKAGFSGRFSEHDVVALLILQKGKCAYCQIDIKNCYQIDHIIPLSKGGSNARANLQLTCKPCNSSKGGKDPIEFARTLNRLL